ncbi:MAG TPA: hypothetical protein VJB97_05025 [Candidatus Paceibacterota bacterium]
MRENLVIFGAGNVGSELRRQAEALGHTVIAQYRSNQFIEGGRLIVSGRERTVEDGRIVRYNSLNDVAVVRDFKRFTDTYGFRYVLSAMPSGGDGAFEADLLRICAQMHKSPITAGKAAIANRSAELEDILDKVGCDAAVGGGIGIIPKLEQDLMLDDPAPISGQFVANATMNKILSGRWRREPMDRLIHECCTLGYAEPESDGAMPSASRVFTVEIDDVRKKIVILVNKILRRRIKAILKFEDIKLTPLTESALAAYTAESARYKYVVYLSTVPFNPPEIDRKEPGSVWFTMNGLHIVGGFRHVPADSALDKWLPDGVGNAFEFEQAGNPTLASGEGAGRIPTARRMLLNMMRMERERHRAMTLGEAARKANQGVIDLPALKLRGHPPGHLDLGPLTRA